MKYALIKTNRLAKLILKDSKSQTCICKRFSNNNNSSPISDGASMLVLMSEKKANELNINPIAEIIGYNDSAISPDLFTMQLNLLKVYSMKLKTYNIDLFEINEAFDGTTCKY